MRTTSIKINESTEGERLETKIERIINNKEPVTDGAPTIYTERKDGVQAGYNIRTDRFEVAIEAMDKVTGAKIAKREDSILKRLNEKEAEKGGGNSGTESTQGTSE